MRQNPEQKTSKSGKKTISRRKFVGIGLTSIAVAGIATFLKKCTGPNIHKNIGDLVNCAFRLTDQNSLLNLEYYFINCDYHPSSNKIWAKYGPHENYMIVRLPQQHVAEQSFLEEDTKFKAATYISGYSYLVFRILFPEDNFFKSMWTDNDGKHTYIDLNRENLLKWDDETRFRLVVRQDLTESLFQLKKVEFYNNDSSKIKEFQQEPGYLDKKQNKKDSIDKILLNDSLENKYPFQTTTNNDTLRAKLPSKENDKIDSLKLDTLRINRLPKVYGDPVTAIELPWRLIISPKLPDSSRFKFKWDIDIPTKNVKDQTHRHKLWTATLSITEREDDEYIDRKTAEENNYKENPSASTGSLNDIINQLELMILGSPDYPDPDLNPKYDAILPTSVHRKDLVALYIKLKILARTEKLTLSAIGTTVKIHLKNEKIEDALKQGIGVIEWNQIISLGRDEKVEISTLFLEAEFGHKMAYIIIAERELKNGIYPLIKNAFIMPLDITKDYTNHITQDILKVDSNGNTLDKKPKEIVSRFNSPFKKITFLETKPKLFVPAAGKTKFNQNELNQTETSFEFEAIDWHGNVIRFTKKINALPFGVVVKKEGEFADKSNLSNIISPPNNAIYEVDSTKPPALKDTIPFYSRASVDSILIKTDSSSTEIYTIDTLLKAQRDSSKTFNSLIPNSFPKIQENIQLESIQNWLENFIQIYKDDLNKILVGSNYRDIIDQINTDLDTDKANLKKSVSRIIKVLIDKYIKQNANYRNVIKQWIEVTYSYFKSVNGFFNYLSIPEYDKKVDFPDFINIAELQPYFDRIKDQKANELKGTVTNLINDVKFKITVDNWHLKYQNIFNEQDTSFEKLINLFSSYNLYDFITINSPDLKTFINNLVAINNADLTSLIKNIKQRIKIIYDIEEKAKNIPGLILLQKQKIGYAIKEKYDDERQVFVNKLKDATGQVKKSLSELESEYIIFKGGLREKTENGVFDFFHDYAIIPQVAQAKVYVSALNKLVNEDLPISINYARDYLENQIRETEFEVKQNAAMVFAEVQQYSREQVKGLIQKIGEKMPGLNVEIPAHYLTYARNPEALKQEIYEKLKKDLGETFEENYKQIITDYSRDLIFISEDVKNAVKVMDDLRNADPKKYFKDLGAKLFGSIGLEDILDIGFDLPRITELPDKIIYQVSTDKFKNFRAAFVQFTPHTNNNTTRLELFISKNLKNVQEYYAYTQLNNFSVGVIIGGTEVLTVMFDQFKITSAPNQPKKTDVSITDVKLGGPLEFIADLAKKFMAPGNGMRIKPGPRNLSVDYTIALPNISAPAFNFKNLQLVIGVNIPYDPSTLKAISFTFGVNKPEDKFLVSAGIYGGRGHFMLRATPKGIEQIDIAIELGAYATIDLGIGRGEVFLFFGFWFVCGKDDEGQNLIKAVAYVICSGSATVLGFITIGVNVLIALTYIKRGAAALFYGEAVVTYSVKIAFFKKEFSIHYYKEIAGSSNGNNTQSLQTGAIFLDTANPGGVTMDKNEADGFTDVFEDEKTLKKYLDCFA